MMVPIGGEPSKLIAIFKTHPARSMLHGGVSLQPPTKSTRTGNSTFTLLGWKGRWVQLSWWLFWNSWQEMLPGDSDKCSTGGKKKHRFQPQKICFSNLLHEWRSNCFIIHDFIYRDREYGITINEKTHLRSCNHSFGVKLSWIVLSLLFLFL